MIEEQEDWSQQYSHERCSRQWMGHWVNHEEKESFRCKQHQGLTRYDKVSDQGPVWVRKDVIFQVQEQNIFIL